MRVGILALQGDVKEHRDIIESLSANAADVRSTSDLDSVDALIIPGGESTTLSGLLRRRGLHDAIAKRLDVGMPILGTCAGAIFLANQVTGGGDVAPFGAIDMTIERNYYGRQIDSFEATVDPEEHFQSTEIHGVFIRAPRITKCSQDVLVLARYDGDPVVVRQGSAVALTFHPELAGDSSIHRWFIERVVDGGT